MHPLLVVCGHLPAWFLATTLGTAPPCSPAPPTCPAPSFLFVSSPLHPGCAIPHLRAPPHPHALHPFAHVAGVQHRQCTTLPSFPFADNPLHPGCATPHPWFTRPIPPTHPPPLCTPDGGTAQTVRHPPLLSVHGQSPLPRLRHPPPPVYAPHPAHTPSTPLRAQRRCSTDSAPPSSFPFVDSPLCLGCTTPHPQFMCLTLPACLPPLCVHAGDAGGTVCLPFFLGRGDCPPSFRKQSLPPALPFAHMPGAQEAQRAHLPTCGSPLCSGYAIPAPQFYVPHPTRPVHPPPLHMHAKGWCTPVPSSPTQPMLVPAPPCSRLT